MILIMQYLFAMRKVASACGSGFIAKTAVFATSTFADPERRNFRWGRSMLRWFSDVDLDNHGAECDFLEDVMEQRASRARLSSSVFPVSFQPSLVLEDEKVSRSEAPSFHRRPVLVFYLLNTCPYAVFSLPAARAAVALRTAENKLAERDRRTMLVFDNVTAAQGRCNHDLCCGGERTISSDLRHDDFTLQLIGHTAL